MATDSSSRSAFLRLELAITPETEQVRHHDLNARIIDWFDQLRGPVLGYLISIGVRHCEAEEIIQETFVALYRHLHSAGDDRNIRGWVFRVAHNLAVNRLKSSRYEGQMDAPQWDALSDRAVDAVAAPDQALLDAERRHQCRESSAGLEGGRPAVVLCARQ